MLERLPRCPQSLLLFHIWYPKENDCIERLVTGHNAISARGIDRLFEIGGPARLAASCWNPESPSLSLRSGLESKHSSSGG